MLLIIALLGSALTGMASTPSMSENQNTTEKVYTFETAQTYSTNVIFSIDVIGFEFTANVSSIGSDKKSNPEPLAILFDPGISFPVQIIHKEIPGKTNFVNYFPDLRKRIKQNQSNYIKSTS